MKGRVRKELLIGVLVISVILGMIAFIAAGATEKNGCVNYAETQDVRDGCKYTPHDPIYIFGNSGFASQASDEGWAGDGTEENPYIIEGYDIDASSANGIEIKNTDVYFIIRNCNIHNGENTNRGIWFVGVENGKIENVTLHDNRDGVRLDQASNNQIIYCNITGNTGYGVFIYEYTIEPSNYNIFHHNNFINNNQNAYDPCTNFWDYDDEGNFWDDYFGTDDNGDWIGNIAYNISGNSNQDNHSLMYPYPVGNPSKPKGYSSIQDAIDDASAGDTVYVWDETYYENIIIDKTISLVGRDRNNTIIDGNGTGDVVYISADWVNVSGFTVQNGGMEWYDTGIEFCSSNNMIENCDVSHNYFGILLYTSSDNKILHCKIDNNIEGIPMWFSSNRNVITHSSISNNNFGIWVEDSSNENNITNCNVSNNNNGIWISDSSNGNTINYSSILNSENGLWIQEYSNNNHIYHNNFFNNTQNAYDECTNFWNTSSEGNHWSDYDESSEGAYDNNTDGIVDTPYYIPGESNMDNYPFMNPSGWEEVGLTPHDPIYIDSNDDFASQAENEGWVGNGTEGNPYIIENYDINASGGGGIEIRYTDVYFVIRNCYIHDGWIDEMVSFSGIFFYNVINGKIDSCTLVNNDCGVYLASYSNTNQITNCVLSNNYYAGIFLWYHANNNIINNCTLSNTGSGIYIQQSSNKNSIINCTVSNNPKGVYIRRSSNNTVSCCNLSDNGYGIYIHVYADTPASYNSIYHNNFINNTQNAYDDCTNFWDNGNEGNYWSDYDEPSEGAYDNNTDGIVDTPYAILGGSNYDNYPFMEPSGWQQITGPVHNLDKDTYYNTIQEAIDDANVGDTIEVSNGTYYENVIINKTITLIGEDRNNTIIDGSGTGDVIYISADWVNVSGFGVRDSGWECHGIRLYYSSNNVLTNCSVYNNYCGILCYASSNNNISNCHMWDNERVNLYVYGYDKQNFAHIIDTSNTIEGRTLYYLFDLHNLTLESVNTAHITLAWCSNITIKNSNITNGDGIYLPYSSNNNLLHCAISGNYMGVYLFCSSVNNITNCTVYDNFVGIYILTSGVNYLSHSICYNNSYGVLLTSSSKFNEVTYCNISENDNYGIYVSSGSEYGAIHHNNFINNTNNAYDECSNYWDDGIGKGNYWDNYDGTDENGDGIGDTPYNISGGDNKDNYPLIHEFAWWDTEKPVISLISSEDNSIIKPGTVLDFDIIDANLWKVSYSINSGDSQSFSLDYNISTDGWADATYNITIYAKDWGMNENTEIFMFTIDSIQPNINITGVINGNYYSTNATPIIDISDTHLNEDGTIIALDGASFVSRTKVSAEGEHTLYVYAVDKAGNNISQTIIFIIDKTKPIITVAGVADGSYYNTDVVPVVDVSDTNINIASITLNDNPFTNGTTINIENTYTLVVQAADKAGNNANKTISFIIDKTAPAITITESSQTTKEKTFTMHWSTTANDVQYYKVSTDGLSWENVSTSIQHTFTLSKGANTLYVRGTDLAGNTGTADITVTYQEKKGKPGIIPGFEITIFLVVLGIIMLLKRKFLN